MKPCVPTLTSFTFPFTWTCLIEAHFLSTCCAAMRSSASRPLNTGVTQLATCAYLSQLGPLSAHPVTGGLTANRYVCIHAPGVSSTQSPGGSSPSKCGSYPANIRHSNRSASARTSFGIRLRSTLRELVRPLTTCTTFRWTSGSSRRCSM